MVRRKRRIFVLQILLLFTVFSLAAASKEGYSSGCCMCGCPTEPCLQNSSAHGEDAVRADGQVSRRHNIVLTNDPVAILQIVFEHHIISSLH